MNRYVREVLDRAERLRLPDWYLAAGCLFQTVWKVLDGHGPDHIGEYDLIYFDLDRSWEAEDVVIRRCAEVFADLPATASSLEDVEPDGPSVVQVRPSS